MRHHERSCLRLTFFSPIITSFVLACVFFSLASRTNAQTTPTGSTCQQQQTQCGQDCVDLRSDSNNCGKCGDVCQSGKTCSAGKCKAVKTCKSGTTSCGGRCVNLASDLRNCGACGSSCNSGQKCSKGACKDVAAAGNKNPANQPTSNSPFDCRLGQEWCGARCVDSITFVTDSLNCGRCGNQCSFSETCTGGFCTCAGGYTMCMGSCVSETSFVSDTSNCGSCGNHCSIGQSCLGGSCVKIP